MVLNLNFLGSAGRSRITNAITRSASTKAQSRDLIGSPDPVSNLFLIKYAVGEKENDSERKLRERREELQNWNHSFWTEHNKCFAKKKEEFVTELLKTKTNQTISADEMSVFYKRFLDDNWEMHIKYLLEWYKKNAYVTLLNLYVLLRNACKKS